MNKLMRLLGNLMRRDRVERDLDDELRAAFDILVEEKMQNGSSPAMRDAPPVWRSAPPRP